MLQIDIIIHAVDNYRGIITLTMKRITILTYVVIIIFAGWVRLYQLGHVPSGLTVDEADIGYDAYSIIKTQRDQWGAWLPLNGFRGFGDYRPVLYTYLVIPAVWTFDLTPFAVRLPSAMFGILSPFALYFLVRKFFSHQTGLVAAFLMVVSPWAIGLSRVGIESNVAIFFMLLGMLCLSNIKTSWRYLMASVICFAGTIYLYTAYTLFTPLLIGVMLLFQKNYALRHKKNILLGMILFCTLLVPFLGIQQTGIFSRASTEGFLVNTDSVGIIQTINEKRGSCMQMLNNIGICRLVANKPLEFVLVFLKNYLHHFSIDYLYLSGTPVHRVILPEMGLGYYFEFIFLLAGLYYLFRNRKVLINRFLLLIFFISPIPDSLTGSGNFSRLSMMMPFFLTIEAIGLLEISKHLIANLRLHKKTVGVCYVSTYILVVALFSVQYFTHYRTKFSTKYTYKELVQDIVSAKNNYDNIYISNHLVDSELHVYYLFYTKYNPQKYQKKTHVAISEKPNGWTEVDRIENVHFVGKIPTEISSHSLLIGAPEEFPKNAVIKKTIKNLGGGIIFLEVDNKL